jgi:hypothetical protein
VIHIDTVVTTDAGLAAALASSATVIEVDGTVPLTTVKVIPGGKTVIIRGVVTPVATNGLTINGTVYVGQDGILNAASTTPVIVSGGVLNVGYAGGGTLSIDAATSVDNGAGATALGTTKVSIGKSGALAYTSTFSGLTAVTDVLRYAGNGTLNATLTDATNTTPSDVVSAYNTARTAGATAGLAITANKTDGAATLVIPEGLKLTTNAVFTNATSIEVEEGAALNAASGTGNTTSGVHILADGDVTLGAAKLVSSVGGTSVPSKVGAKGKLTVSTSVSLDTGAELEVSGDYVLNNSVTGTNGGTVTVKSGGVIKNGVGVNITGSGTNVVEAGGVVYFNSQPTPFIGTSSDTDAQFQLTSGTFTYNSSGYILAGTATLKDKDGSADLESPEVYFNKDEIPLTIKRGAELILEEYAVLVLGGGIDVYADIPLKGDLTGNGNAPKITLQTGSSAGYSWSSDYHYFYAHGYASTAGGGAAPIPVGSYEWKTAVASTSFAGWEATE